MGDARLYGMPVRGMHAYRRGTPLRWEIHAYRRGTPMRWEMHAYRRHAYEIAYGGCPSIGCIPYEIHAYE
jgi:hypothetical protein